MVFIGDKRKIQRRDSRDKITRGENTKGEGGKTRKHPSSTARADKEAANQNNAGRKDASDGGTFGEEMKMARKRGAKKWRGREIEKEVEKRGKRD